MMTKEEAVKAYDQLVQFRQQNQLYKTKENLGKVETHHILPTSCGGEDVPENRIDLLAKEHFMAHVYLWIIHHEDEFHYQTMCALNNMIKGTLKGFRKELREFILASEEYQKAKEEFAKYNSETIGQKISGEKNGMADKCWIKNSTTGESKIWEKTKQLPEGWSYGRFQSKTEKVLHQLTLFSISTRGKRCIYNPITNQRKYINADEQLPTGYIFGNGHRTEIQKRNISNTLKTKSPKGTLNPKHIQEQIEFLRLRYAYYLEFGFDAMTKMFDYPYSQQNFCMRCRKYLPEYSKYARYKKK